MRINAMSIRADAIIDCNEEPEADRIQARLDWALPEETVEKQPAASQACSVTGAEYVKKAENELIGDANEMDIGPPLS